MDTLGKRLKELREEKRFTLEYVANHLKTTKTSIARYEKNDREPKSEMITALADFYNVSTDYLLGKSSEKNISNYESKYTKYDSEVADKFVELTDENKKVVAMMINQLLKIKEK